MQWHVKSWPTCWCSASIKMMEENSQVDPIHSSSEATPVLFHQDVTILQLDQLSQDFKAFLSFPNINSQARPFDFMLEHSKLNRCWPLLISGAFLLSGRGPTLGSSQRDNPQPDTTEQQLSSSHDMCQQEGRLRTNSQECRAPAVPPSWAIHYGKEGGEKRWNMGK